MSGYPIVLDGTSLKATVIGGGAVALRKIQALRESGATVSVVALEGNEALRQAVADDPMIQLTTAAYDIRYLNGAQIVIAATNDAVVNGTVAQDAKRLGILVNVVNAPELGDFVTPAVHRAGDLVIGVVTGGVPSAAARIRDEIARRFDRRYAEATALLREIRSRALAQGNRKRWEEAKADLTSPEFCTLVESGELERRAAPWR